MRDGQAEKNAPPELLAFNDWDAVTEKAEQVIRSSDWIASSNAHFPWQHIHDRLFKVFCSSRSFGY